MKVDIEPFLEVNQNVSKWEFLEFYDNFVTFTENSQRCISFLTPNTTASKPVYQICLQFLLIDANICLNAEIAAI